MLNHALDRPFQPVHHCHKSYNAVAYNSYDILILPILGSDYVRIRV